MSDPSAKVVALHADRPFDSKEPNHELIQLLEELTERAKSGELQGIAYAGITDHRMVETGYTDSTRCIDAAAAVGLLFHRFMDAWNKGSD